LSPGPSKSSSSNAACTGADRLDRRTDLQDAAPNVTPLHDQLDPAELAHRIVEIVSDHKGSDVVMLKTGELTSLADYFVIATGRSDRQVAALAGSLAEELRAQGVRPLGIEGRSGARWILLDFDAVIVHLFTPDERERYDLEKLWSAAPAVVRLV
jgi:ribosome-associated protein